MAKAKPFDVPKLSPGPKPCASLLRRGSRLVGWCYTRRKRKSSTPQIPTARDAILLLSMRYLSIPCIAPIATAWSGSSIFGYYRLPRFPIA